MTPKNQPSGKRERLSPPLPPNYVWLVWAKPDKRRLWQVSWPRRISPISSFLFQIWTSNFLLFPPIFHLPHFLRQCFFQWVSRTLVLESPGMLVKNGDSWSYSKTSLFNSSVGAQEPAFLTIPQVILMPIENCPALKPSCLTEPSGKLTKNLASILTTEAWGRAQACAF